MGMGITIQDLKEILVWKSGVNLTKIDTLVLIKIMMVILTLMMDGSLIQKVLPMLSHPKKVNGLILTEMVLEIIKQQMLGNLIVVY